MAGPPLQLEESFFDTVRVDAVPEHSPSTEGRPQQHGVQVHIDLATLDDSPGMLRVALDLTDKDVDGETPATASDCASSGSSAGPERRARNRMSHRSSPSTARRSSTRRRANTC